jgi:hypothetical protein
MTTIYDLSEVGIDSQSSIWLYTDIGYFIQMIEEGALPIDSEVKYARHEGNALPADDCFTNIENKTNRLIRNITCLSEFYSTGGDTRSMWARHRPNQLALQTSIDQLCKALSEDRFELYIVPVTNYCQLDSVSIKPDNSTPSKISASDFVSQFSYKDQSYDQEQAIRLVGIRTGAVGEEGTIDLRRAGTTRIHEHETIAADRDQLINSVIVSPHTGGWIADLLNKYVDCDFGISNSVRQLSLG